MTPKGWLAEAVRVAAEMRGPHRHSALLVRNGRLVAVAGARRRGPSPEASVDAWRASWIHAEQAVLGMAGDDAKGATLYLARVTRGGVTALAAPCVRCEAAIARAGVKRVVHT